MNRVELHGGVTGEPKYGYTRRGRAWATCTLAVSAPTWDPDTQREVVSTTYARLQLWGGMAEQLMELSPRKGEKLWVVGQLEQSPWREDSEEPQHDEKDRKSTRVVVTWFLPTNPQYRPADPTT